MKKLLFLLTMATMLVTSCESFQEEPQEPLKKGSKCVMVYTTSNRSILEPMNCQLERIIASNTYQRTEGQIVFSEHLSTIPYTAFYQSSYLTSVTIPDCVQAIEGKAFANCPRLEKVYIHTSQPPMATADIFEGASSVLEIYVPDNLVRAYKTEAGWSAYRKNYVSANPPSHSGDCTIYYTTSDGDIVEPMSSLLERIVDYNNYASGKGTMILDGHIQTLPRTAFYQCSSLVSINLPECIITIGDNSFTNCENLKEVHIGERIVDIESKAFAGCKSLKSVVIDATIPPIATTDMFDGASSDVVIRVPNESVEAYKNAEGWAAYKDKIYGKKDLIPLPEPEPEPEPKCFIYYKTSDESLLEPMNCQLERTMIYNAYENGQGVMAFSEHLSVLPYTAFYQSSYLTSVTIPDCVQAIEGKAFANCPRLEKVYINTPQPPMATADIFEGASSVLEIYVPDDLVRCYKTEAGWSAYRKNYVSANPEIDHENCIISYTTSDGDIVEPMSSLLERVMDSNNYDDEGEMVLNGHIQTLPRTSFYQCSNLVSINLPECIITIGDNAFTNCNNLEKVNIGERIVDIESKAFAGCSSLQEVKIYATVPPIATTDMFDGASSDVVIRVPDNSVEAYKKAEGWAAYKDNIIGHSDPLPGQIKPVGSIIYYTSMDGDIVEPTAEYFGAEIISNTYKNGQGEMMFDGVVEMIGLGCFKNCYNLLSITLPDSVTIIERQAFAGCEDLRSVTFGKGLVEIEDEAFKGCTFLEKVTLPESLKSVGLSVFMGCSELTGFYGNSKFVSADNRCLLNGTDLVAFAQNGLTSYTIPAGVKIIQRNAFAGLHDFTSITIPSSVDAIYPEAFANCGGLKTVHIYDIQSIGSKAFAGSCNLKYIYVYPKYPPKAAADMFEDTDANKVIYVPLSSARGYHNAEGWSAYSNCIKHGDF